jgi:hypothetical protein
VECIYFKVNVAQRLFVGEQVYTIGEEKIKCIQLERKMKSAISRRELSKDSY